MALDAEHHARQVAPKPRRRLAADFWIRFVEVRAAQVHQNRGHAGTRADTHHADPGDSILLGLRGVLSL